MTENDEEEKRGKMVGFLFGNVDKKGKLDEEYLEEDAKENIDALEGKVETVEDEDQTTTISFQSQSQVRARISDDAITRKKVERPKMLPEEDEDYDEEPDPGKPSTQNEVQAMETDALVAPADDAMQKGQSAASGKGAHSEDSQRKKASSPEPSEEDDEDLLLMPVNERRGTNADEEDAPSSKIPLSVGEGSMGIEDSHRKGFKCSAPLKDALQLGSPGLGLSESEVLAAKFRQYLCCDWEKKVIWSEAVKGAANGEGGKEPSRMSSILMDTHIQPLSSEQALPAMQKEEEENDKADQDEVGNDKISGQMKEFALQVLNIPQLESCEWEKKIMWNDQTNKKNNDQEQLVFLDLNDDRMVFEYTGQDFKAETKGTLALVIPSQAGSARGKKGSPGKAEKNALLKFNISNDEHYITKSLGKGAKEKSQENKVRHSLCALKMVTMPFTETLKTIQIRFLHRPRGKFTPPRKALIINKATHVKSKGSYDVNAKFLTLVGFEFALQEPVRAASTTVEMLWSLAKQHSSKIQKAFKDEKPKLMLSGMRRPLKFHTELGEGKDGLNMKGDMHVWMLTNRISIIKNANKKVFEEPLKPPGAFKTAKELSPKDGYAFMLEYVEEFPLLVNNNGMGLRLLSYYRKQDKDDNTWKNFTAGLSPLQRLGRYGHVIPLAESDDAPFLGGVQKGVHQLGVDCNLFRAPSFHHSVQESDFLLFRNNMGKWMLRELTSVIVVGQQEPRVRTPWPGSIQIREYEEKRFQDHVFRDLRKKLKSQAAGHKILPEVSVQTLKTLFPNNSEQLIRNRLRQLCDCMPVKQNNIKDGKWSMKPGARIPEEVELRQICTPELVCAYESMRSCQERLSAMGIKRTELLRMSNERMKLAVLLLPDGEKVRETARFVTQIIRIASWALISNFCDLMEDGRGTFALGGLGDPSGRGRGFSYVKSSARGIEKENEKRAEKSSKVVIAGTKTDLRRLSMDKARNILRTLGVPDEEIAQLTRWNRINLIQHLSKAAAGSKLGDIYSGFTRQHRRSAAEAQHAYQEKCHDIFQKQVLALSADGEEQQNDAANTNAGEPDDLANELENMLEDSEEEEEQPKEKSEADMLAEDEAEMRKIQDEGLFGEKKKKKKAKEPPKPVETKPKLRLRRIFKKTHEDGTYETKEVIITDPNKIETLRLARANYGGFGEGGMINLSKERKRLQDRHLKLKKRIMKQEKKLNLLQKSKFGSQAEISGTKFTLKGLGSPERSKIDRPMKRRKISPLQKLNRLLREKIHMPIRKMPIAKPFAKLVDISRIKDYNKYVTKQISMGEISKHLQQNQYESWISYQNDITLLVTNAKTYNDGESGGKFKNPNLAQQAEVLKILVNLRIARYATQLIEARGICEPQLVALREKYNEELPWIECSRCKKWRLVSFEEHQRILAAKSKKEHPWFCEHNEDHPGAACDDIDDDAHFQQLKEKYASNT